jgi:hypothetical protein
MDSTMDLIIDLGFPAIMEDKPDFSIREGHCS